jgi:hypothetical protein
VHLYNGNRPGVVARETLVLILRILQLHKSLAPAEPRPRHHFRNSAPHDDIDCRSYLDLPVFLSVSNRTLMAPSMPLLLKKSSTALAVVEKASCPTNTT